MFFTRFFILVWWVVGRTTAFFTPCHCRSYSYSYSSTTTTKTTTSLFSSSTPKAKKKKKKNKYEQFSKVQQDTDPFQELLAESERKLAALQQEQQQQSTFLPTAPPPPPPLQQQFPDTATIDPYDPRTFGYVTLGTIQGAHGVQGWIKVKITDAVDATLVQQSCTQTGWVHVRLPHKRAPRPILLQQGRLTTEQQYLVQLQDILDREQAQTLRGATLYVRHEQIVSETDDDEEEEEEYNVSELVGMEVFLTENPDGYVGKVSGIVFCEDISSIPLGHDFLELELPRADSGMASYKDELVLIPFVPPLVPIVDVQQRRIHISPPAGLLDLTYVRSDKVRVKGFLPARRTTMD